MIAIDIETVAQENLESVIPEFEGRKGTKDLDKLAAQIAVKKSEWIDKAALDPNYGRIACICYYGDDRVGALVDTREEVMLKDFWDTFANEPEIVTFNGKSFDIPYIIRRSWYNNIKPTISYDSSRYNSITHFDLRLILAGGDTHAKGKLSDYANLKLSVDMDAKGSEVQGLWDAGKIEEIVTHCRQDVEVTWNLFESMRGYYL